MTVYEWLKDIIANSTVLILLAAAVPLAAAPEGAWEQFPDGSTGRTTEFRGAGGVVIAAYVRKPAGPGPFPVVVNLHGGNPNVEGTYRYGRSASGYVAAGWAIYSIDFRPNGPGRAGPLDPVEYEDTAAAIETARRLPFVDPERVALTGGSHGAHVINRMASRVDARCAVLSSPTWIDSGQMKRALEQEKDPVTLARLKLLTSFVDQIKDPAVRAAFDRASALNEAAQVRFPLLIIDGGQDISLPQWMVNEYVAKLRAAGKTVETYLPKTGEHGFDSGTSPEGKEAQQRSFAFLKKYLAPAPKQ
jgi:dipeptidyl aminopeptidase/acylaminoacyl peptidase